MQRNRKYDFSEGVRGKYARRYAQSNNIVVLPPDLAIAFPTRDAVVDALRGLLSLAQKIQTPRKGRKAARRAGMNQKRPGPAYVPRIHSVNALAFSPFSASTWLTLLESSFAKACSTSTPASSL